jgi:hypothetical protein
MSGCKSISSLFSQNKHYSHAQFSQVKCLQLRKTVTAPLSPGCICNRGKGVLFPLQKNALSFSLTAAEQGFRSGALPGQSYDLSRKALKRGAAILPMSLS